MIGDSLHKKTINYTLGKSTVAREEDHDESDSLRPLGNAGFLFQSNTPLACCGDGKLPR